MRKVVIGVIGAAQASDADMEVARRVGELLAKRDAVVVCGGLEGVMEAAAKGAQQAGGAVIGVLPTMRPEDANAHVSIAIATGMGDARNTIIANSAAGFIAIGGSFGTLSEIAFALKRNKPVVSVGSWALEQQRLGDAPLHIEANAQAAVGKLFALLANTR